MRRGEQPQGRPQQRQPTPPPCDHLPQSVRQVWQRVWNDERCKNLSLLLERYAPWRKNREGIWDMRMRYRRGARIEEATGQGAKGLWLRDDERDLVDAPIKPNSRIDELLLAAFRERWHCLLDWYRQRGYEIRDFKAEPTWRFVVGLGAAHVLETGITLHRIFGLPIIPASGLKGAARAYAQLVEGKTEDDPEFVAVFGTTEQAGGVVFLDAVPCSTPKFELDILNPHYPNYYRTQGGHPPADWESPNPVFFLTVSETPYLFAIATRTKNANGLLDVAEQWLKGALKELGIGAKTSADYGYWTILKGK